MLNRYKLTNTQSKVLRKAYDELLENTNMEQIDSSAKNTMNRLGKIIDSGKYGDSDVDLLTVTYDMYKSK